MQDPNDVLVQAADGVVKHIAEELVISLARAYELLGKDNPYPKLWRILRPLGRHNPDGLRLVQCDFNRRCESILTKQPSVTLAQINDELDDVIQSELEKKPASVCKTEILQALSILQARLEQIEAEENKQT